MQRQRARHVRPGGRGGRRRQHPAAGQDRHHHLRQPAGGGVRGAARCRAGGAAGRRPVVQPGRPDARRVARSSPWPWLRAPTTPTCPGGATFIEFSAHTRMSGVDLSGGTEVRKGAGVGPRRPGWDDGHARPGRGRRPDRVRRRHAAGGRRAPGRPLGPARVLGVVHLKDVVKPGMRDRFAQLRAMGIRTVMITGDNPRTAKAIAGEAGVDDFLAEATPEDKLDLIRAEQTGGRMVAMTGDGTNDAPALAAADVGRGHEHRHVGGQGGRQHGRPRLRPDQADRRRGDRQAAADHPRRPDHVLDRQRHREVLRDHPGHVRRRLSRPAGAQRHAAAARRPRRSCPR